MSFGNRKLHSNSTERKTGHYSVATQCRHLHSKVFSASPYKPIFLLAFCRLKIKDCAQTFWQRSVYKHHNSLATEGKNITHWK